MISCLIFILLLSISAVSATENNTLNIDNTPVSINNDSDISVHNFNTLTYSGKEITITSDNYDDYFNKYSGEIRSGVNINSGDILKLGSMNNKAFVIDRQLTITPLNQNDVLSNCMVHLVKGSDGSTVTGLKIISTETNVILNGVSISDLRLHGIWVSNSDNITLSYNTVKVADSQGVYAMPLGYSNNLRIYHNNLTTYSTCVMLLGSCNNAIISNNYLETLSYSDFWTSNLIYFNPYGHADYQGPADCSNVTIVNNYLKAFSNKPMCIAMQLIGNSPNLNITNNTIIKGYNGIDVRYNNATIIGNSLKDSAIAIVVASNSTVAYNNITGGSIGGGISSLDSPDSIPYIHDNIIHFYNSEYGISSNGNSKIYKNNINIDNYGVGIILSQNESNVYDNIIHVNVDEGITFKGSKNIINNNIISSNNKGISSSFTDVFRCYNNVISNNVIRSNDYGIYIKGYLYKTTISGNVIETNASIGIYKEVTDTEEDNNSDNMINGVIYDATALIINDDNFYNYFNNEGYLNFTFKENTTNTIFFTFLSHKDVYFTDKINIISNKMSNLLIDVTIHLSADASGSLIRDFNFLNRNKVAILVDGLDDVSVKNNNITLILDDNLTKDNSAIMFNGICNNCFVSSNNIFVKANTLYSYGVSISAYNLNTGLYNNDFSHNVDILDNTIIMISKNIAEAIYTDASVSSNILRNKINIIAGTYAYGIATGNVIGRQFGLNVSSNEIVIYADKMAYLIELHMNDNINVENNYLYSKSCGVYGIAIYLCNNISIRNNDLNIFGSNISNLKFSSDVLGNGLNGIFISKFTNQTRIISNTIYTNAERPIFFNENKSIITIDSNSFVIDDENYHNYFNNLSDLVFNNPILLLNNISEGKRFEINTSVIISAYKKFNNCSVDLIFYQNASNSRVYGLNFINGSIILNSTNKIVISNNTFDNSYIDIESSGFNSIINNSFYNRTNMILLNKSSLNLIYGNLINVSDINTFNGIILSDSEKNEIFNNEIFASGGKIILIESINGNWNKILNNSLCGNGSSVYAYYSINSNHDLISYNNVIIYGNASKTDQAGFYIKNGSFNDINNNRIITHALNNDDYAIYIDNNKNLSNSVILNFLISSNGLLRANDAVFALYDLVIDNSPCNIYVSSLNGNDRTGDGTKDNPYASLDYALNKAINHAIIFIDNGNYLLKNIIINKNITLNGLGLNVVINGDSNYIFNITKEGSLSINGLTIKNAKNIIGGAVFYNMGKLIINNSSFENCSSYYDNSNPIFTKNSDNDDEYSYDCSNLGLGGVILNYGSLFINSSLFNNNFAHVGGVIANFAGAKILNSKFINNTAVHGGAIYTLGNNEILINDSEFISNTGLISLDYCKIIKRISSWSIIDGYSYSYTPGCNYTIGFGGAIFSNSPLTIENSLFKNNSALTGGAIAQPYTSSPKNYLNIKNSEFLYNYAKDTRLSHSDMLDNYLFNKYNGGAIYGSALNFIVKNSSFSHNQATTDGGAIYASSPNGIIDESNFTDNRGGISYGALGLKGNFQITRSIISNNSAYYGGAIGYEGKTSYGHVENNLNIFNSTISNNFALNSGGAFVFGPSNVVISHSNIVGNFAPSGSTMYSTYSSQTFVNALGNWWGSNRGPDDSVWSMQNILFKNWLKNEVNWKSSFDDHSSDKPVGPGGSGSGSVVPGSGIIVIPGSGSGISTGGSIGGSGSGSSTGGSGSGSASSSGSIGIFDGIGIFTNATESGSQGSNSNPNNNQNGTVNSNSYSRTNSSSVNSNLETVGLVDNAVSSSSAGEGSGKSSSADSSSKVAYELDKKVDKKLNLENNVYLYLLILFIAIGLFIIGFKRHDNEEN